MIKPLALEKVLWMKQGEGIAASGVIPPESEFFKDHFPGFPILPGVLAIEVLKQSAEHYMRAASGGDDRLAFQLKKVRGVRFSRYLKPGDAWESRLELVSQKDSETVWNARLVHQGEVAVQLRFILETSRLPAGQSIQI